VKFHCFRAINEKINETLKKPGSQNEHLHREIKRERVVPFFVITLPKSARVAISMGVRGKGARDLVRLESEVQNIVHSKLNCATVRYTHVDSCTDFFFEKFGIWVTASTQTVPLIIFL
jgi:hypothetical protein